MKKNPRTIATKILLQVIQHHHSLTAALSQTDLTQTQANLVKELCFGMCRWYFYLTEVADNLLGKPLKTRDQDIYVLILLGLYQILYLHIPEHAIVQETVEAAKQLKKPWATKLINGVLRNFLRMRQAVSPLSDNHSAHPPWMNDAILAAYPEAGKAILHANNQHPPLCLRVNCLQTTRDAYLKNLSDAGVDAVPVPDAPWAIVLDKPQDVTTLPGFEKGQFSVQDSSAQFAAMLLDLKPGQRVLDACAAPGGKTTHVLETEPELALLVVLDKDAARLTRVKENVQRLGLKGNVVYHAADAVQVSSWSDGKLFDRILLDAPCSGSGVIRRHPDIKLLRQFTDIAQFAEQQRALLAALWPQLKPGGILLYATCSIFPDENAAVIREFLSTHADASEKEIEVPWGIAAHPGRQILTGQENRDGFYYARLVKI